MTNLIPEFQHYSEQLQSLDESERAAAIRDLTVIGQPVASAPVTAEIQQALLPSKCPTVPGAKGIGFAMAKPKSLTRSITHSLIHALTHPCTQTHALARNERQD